MDANIRGGNSVTAILFNRYVEPHMTYIEKNARAIRIVLRGKEMYFKRLN